MKYREECEEYSARTGDLLNCKRPVTHDHPDPDGPIPQCTLHACPECKERPVKQKPKKPVGHYDHLKKVELISLLTIREKNMVDVREDYEQRLAYKDDQMNQLASARVKERDDLYEKNKKLSDQLHEMKLQVKDLEERVKKESIRAFTCLSAAEDACAAVSLASRVNVRLMDKLDEELFAIKKKVFER